MLPTPLLSVFEVAPWLASNTVYAAHAHTHTTHTHTTHTYTHTTHTHKHTHTQMC